MHTWIRVFGMIDDLGISRAALQLERLRKKAAGKARES